MEKALKRFEGGEGKAGLAKKVLELIDTELVRDWFSRVLEGKDEGDTLEELRKGVIGGSLTLDQALALALAIGFSDGLRFPD